MKKKILFTSLAFLLLSSLIFVACCKKTCTDASNLECENYDVCYGKTETKASFWMYEQQEIYEYFTFLAPPDTFYKQNLEYIDTDTFKLYNWKQFNGLFEYDKTLRISFKCKNKNANSVKWFIGNNKMIEGKDTYLEFDTSQFGMYKVMMVINYDKNTACFPKETGVDTAIRYLYLQKDTKPVYATVFSGYLESTPNEIFDVEIKYLPCKLKTEGTNFSLCESDSSYFIKGLPREADIPVMQLGLVNTKNFRVGASSLGQIIMNTSGAIARMSAKGEFNKNNIITITYVYKYQSELNPIVEKFIGHIK
jgi:hypothetical protein